MFKITTVCNAGVATSIIAKGLVEKVVEKLGYKNFVKVEACDIGATGTLDSDLIVTSRDLAKMITPSFMGEIPVVTVNNIVSSDGILETLKPILDEVFL